MFNHSCLRCRSKKLRCDDGIPCTNCESKGLGHVCHRPKRKERPRKKDVVKLPGPDIAANAVSSQTIHTAPAPAVASSSSPSSSSAGMSRPLEPGAYTGASLSLARSKVSAIRDSPSSSSANPSAQPSASASKPRQAIKFEPAPAKFRDRLATEAQINEARELLGNVIGAIRVVKYIFHWRCQGNCHSSVHIPTIKQLIRQLYSERWAPELTQDQLSLLLMVGAHSIQFTPRRGPYMYVLKMVEDLGSIWTPPVRQRKLHHLARSILQARLTDNVCSIEGIQTAIMLLLYDLDDDKFKEHVFHYAIRAAKSLGLDRIQYEPGREVPTLEAEMGVRIWWFLVSRDWLSSLGRGAFMLPPDSFSTRLPILVSDEDLAEGRSINVQDGQTSPVAISMPHISLAAMVRELVEARSIPGQTEQNLLQLVADAFDQYCENLPAVFGLQAGATFTPGHGAAPDIYVIQRLETERWLLHQQIFHAYLQLYNLRPEEPVCDQMVALARHILELQDTIRTRCHIIDHMRINVTGVLRAIMVLTVDLIQRHRDAKVSLVRQLTLGKVHESLRKTKDAPALNEGDLNDVNRLLDMEERMWRAKRTAPVLPALTRTGSGGKTPHGMDTVFSATSTTTSLPFGNANTNVLPPAPDMQAHCSHRGSSHSDDVMMSFAPPQTITTASGGMAPSQSMPSSAGSHGAGSSPATSEFGASAHTRMSSGLNAKDESPSMAPAMGPPFLSHSQSMRHSSGEVPQLTYSQPPPPPAQSGHPGSMQGGQGGGSSYMYAPGCSAGPPPPQAGSLHPNSARPPPPPTDPATTFYDVHSLLPSDSALSPLFAMHGLTGSGGVAHGTDSPGGFRGGIQAIFNAPNALKNAQAQAQNSSMNPPPIPTSSNSGSNTPMTTGTGQSTDPTTTAEPTWETIWSFLMQSQGPSNLHQPPPPTPAQQHNAPSSSSSSNTTGGGGADGGQNDASMNVPPHTHPHGHGHTHGYTHGPTPSPHPHSNPGGHGHGHPHGHHGGVHHPHAHHGHGHAHHGHGGMMTMPIPSMSNMSIPTPVAVSMGVRTDAA